MSAGADLGHLWPSRRGIIPNSFFFGGSSSERLFSGAFADYGAIVVFGFAAGAFMSACEPVGGVGGGMRGRGPEINVLRPKCTTESFGLGMKMLLMELEDTKPRLAMV